MSASHIKYLHCASGITEAARERTCDESPECERGQIIERTARGGNVGALSFLSSSYDSEGRLMNVTFPTGMVNNLYADIYSALTVDIESSMTEEEISITTNASALRSFYTLAQGEASSSSFPAAARAAGFCQRLFVIVSGVAGGRC